ncbi:ras GTPase-activating protein 2 isoform X2 [Pangasianodon hypophthalmus]|uniref:ras GTPase-activating protein 2 isoform X2 n=1 Tax=Pangasianodon hypophthalmus TaxID=310915 RepID=UPI0023073150|nr:ras GTPase-activating protein 2 isoform X2 [Pangasianodon hypophthalmus]
MLCIGLTDIWDYLSHTLGKQLSLCCFQTGRHIISLPSNVDFLACVMNINVQKPCAVLHFLMFLYVCFSPFYGEDFYFEIPRPFQCLSFYVYAKSVFQRDLTIGKVALRKEELCNYSGKEHWFPLQPVDANSEVQGKVHLEMKLNEVITDNGPASSRLQVRIIECQGLPLISGQACDSYASVTLIGPARSDQRKTKVKKKTSDPHFDETIYFEVSRASNYNRKNFQVEDEDIEKLEIKVELWNNGNLAQDVFLGETRVSVKILRNDLVHKAWYLLQPRGNGVKCKPDDLGSLRLNVCYTEDNVLPSNSYINLRNLLLKSPDVQPISASAAHILGDVCRDRSEASLPLVRLLLHNNRLLPFLMAIAALELENTQEANTIFRGNSLATRCIDDMMKMVGRNYLNITLKPVLDEICESNKTCEIDPIKLKEGDNVEVNKENLQIYVQKVFSSITESSTSCPPLMCDVFQSLRQLASDRFPSDPHVQYSAVSSFVFLRFFAVAVLSPHTFQLRPHHPDPEVCRTLTLISKTIQTLGSWSSLSKSKLSSFKETYMCDFFKLFQEDKCIEKVKKFLDDISSNVCKGTSGAEDSVVLKEGEVHKRAQGRKRLGQKNFKKRWLRVTSRELSYHKQKGKCPLCVIPVKSITGVEKVDESTFNRKNMFQVIFSDKPLYVQAGNCVEASEWIDVLTQLIRCNTDRLGVFHPAVSSRDTLANIQLEIDCDRETERIFSLFSASLPRLQKMEDACASMSVYLGQQKEQEEYSAFVIQDPKETFRTIKEIKEVLEDLQLKHNAIELTDQPGTIENPIVGKRS